jgi:hypothetical protein
MTKQILSLILVASFLWLSNFVLAEQESSDAVSVEEIVEITNLVSYYQGKDGRARVKMTIVDSQQRQRNREFTILRWDEPNPDESGGKQGDGDSYNGNQKIYVYFHRPADVYQTVFMVWKYLDKDDDRWLYLPALDLVKRISATDKRTSFVGSHFYYEDVSGRSIEDDEHELIETTDNYYVLKNTPKDKTFVEFAYYKMWIHRDTYVVVKSAYFDNSDKNYRNYEALKVETIQGFPTVTKSKMTDLRSGGYTEMEYTNVDYNIGVPESIFTERYLRTAPREYLR